MRYSFIDEVTILVRSGNGGAGCLSFRREKFVPFGGPDGGEGGRGGDVVIRVDPQLNTLIDYKYKPRHLAQNGRPGEGNQKSGHAGKSVILRVPPGTTVFDLDANELIEDLKTENAEVVIAHGGRGGKGNVHFKSSTRQAPDFAQPGEEGEEKKLRLELKLLADVGVVGFPNVGKSSLVSRVSAAKPKIADYPFTTLVPNLGVVRYGDWQSFVIADVPGLIVGAHQGAGLGIRFLKHVERVRQIIHMITVEPDYPDRDPVQDFEAIEQEMKKHNEQLADTPKVLVLNRIDLDFVQEQQENLHAYAEQHNLHFFAISAATGQGIPDLMQFLTRTLSQM